ncbi:MAG: protein kinase [Cyanobacteria bacterium]|nr:protein kinase [Cyanobacteriota bacterium]
MPTFSDTPTPDLGHDANAVTPFVTFDLIASRYKVLESIGEGGMGRVYKAHDGVLRRVVAVKLLSSDRLDAMQAIRFQREAQANSQLKHPAIVEVFDFGVTADGLPFMVMEYVDGKNLKAVLARRPLSGRETINIMVQVCEAMEHAHERKIVHRDLKPANIVATKTGDLIMVRVLDFGISKVFADAEDAQKLTRTGHIIGSPAYLSPEQALGLEVDGRADVYAMGCILFECLTGRPPFVGASSVDVINQHLEALPPSLSEAEPEGIFSSELEAVVQRTLAKEPGQRYSSMSELKEALLSVPLMDSISRETIELFEKEKHESTSFVPPARRGMKFHSAFIVFPLLIVLLPFIWKYWQDQPVSTHREDSRELTESIDKQLDVGALISSRVAPEVEVDDYSSADGLPDTFRYKREVTGKYSIVFASLKRNYAPLQNSELAEFDRFNHKKEIELVWVHNRTLTKEQVEMFARLSPDNLKLEHCMLGDAELAPVRLAKELSRLDVRGSQITSTSIDLLKDLKNLKVLGVQGCANFNGNCLRKVVENCPDLAILDIGDTGVKNAEVHLVCGLKNLIDLDLTNIDHLTDKQVRELSKLKLLTRLGLTSNANLTDETCKVLVKNFPRLNFVGLRKCIHITPNGFEILKLRKGLRCDSDEFSGIDKTLDKFLIQQTDTK